METEIDNNEEDFDIDELLGEDEDSPAEAEEEIVKPKKKSPASPKKIAKKEDVPKVPQEVTEAEADLKDMEWQSFTQSAYDGYQNIKTGEILDQNEAIRRILNYAQEAARNSR